MMQRFRIALTVVGLTIAVVGCGGDSTSEPVATTPPTASATTPTAPAETPEAPLIEVTYADGDITGGGRREVTIGQKVTLQVTSDVADEVHLHGYDKKVDVEPGTPAKLIFTADIPGVFEVELESRGIKLLELVVR